MAIENNTFTRLPNLSSALCDHDLDPSCCDTMATYVPARFG